MKKKVLTSELVKGNDKMFFANSIGILPNPDKILNRYGKNYETYRELKNDPHVWSCIQSRKSGVIALEYEFVHSNENKTANNEVIKIVSDLNIDELIRNILEAPFFGFQPLEIIWTHTGKYFIPKEVIPKPQDYFFFDADRNFRLYNPTKSGGEILPEMKMLVPRYEATWLNPYGSALLTKCYWPVTFKNSSQRFWVNFMEKYGMPIAIGTFNRGATQEEICKLSETLASMVEDTIIVTPEDIKIDLKEPQRTPTVDLYREMIRYCNSEISKALLSQTLTTELDMGSYAAAQTHFKVRKEVILSDISLVEETINTLLGYIQTLNFNTDTRALFKILQNTEK